MDVAKQSVNDQQGSGSTAIRGNVPRKPVSTFETYKSPLDDQYFVVTKRKCNYSEIFSLSDAFIAVIFF